MIHFLADRLTVFLYRNDVIKSDLPIYQFGFELAISSVFGAILVLSLASVIHVDIDGIVFLGSFLLLRSFTGGYHFSTYSRCNLGMLSIFIGCVLLQQLVGVPIVMTGLQLTSLCGLIFIGMHAPRNYVSKYLSKLSKIKFQRIAAVIALLLYMGALVMQWLQIECFVVLHYVISVTGALLLVSKLKER